MAKDNIMKGAEIVEVCGKYPDAKVGFEAAVCGGFLGGMQKVYVVVRGYKIRKDSDGNVSDVIFVEDEVVPRNS